MNAILNIIMWACLVVAVGAGLFLLFYAALPVRKRP